MKQKYLALVALAVPFISGPAFAHVGPEHASSFLAGVSHPLSGLDHIAVMLSVGLWAALNGGRAIWVWPVTFVAAMIVGGVLGMLNVALPFVEPAILASVVGLGLLVVLAIDLPVWLGAIVIAIAAVFHGHAHGTEVAGGAGGAAFMAGFAISTAALHLVGLVAALALLHINRPSLVRLAGAACVVLGLGLTKQFM